MKNRLFFRRSSSEWISTVTLISNTTSRKFLYFFWPQSHFLQLFLIFQLHIFFSVSLCRSLRLKGKNWGGGKADKTLGLELRKTLNPNKAYEPRDLAAEDSAALFIFFLLQLLHSTFTKESSSLRSIRWRAVVYCSFKRTTSWLENKNVLNKEGRTTTQTYTVPKS